MSGPKQCSPTILAQQVRDHSWLVWQKICPRGAISWGEGGGAVRDMAPPLEEVSSLKRHSLVLRPNILHKSAVVIFRQQFKTFYSNNFTLSSKCVAYKKKSSVYFSAFPYIHSFPWPDRITTYVFFSKTSSGCRQ